MVHSGDVKGGAQSNSPCGELRTNRGSVQSAAGGRTEVGNSPVLSAAVIVVEMIIRHQVCFGSGMVVYHGRIDFTAVRFSFHKLQFIHPARKNAFAAGDV